MAKLPNKPFAFCGHPPTGCRKGTAAMLQISSCIFILSLCIFLGVMIREPRSLWSGVSFFWMMICLALLLFVVFTQYGQWLTSQQIVTYFLVFLLFLTVACILAFPGALILMFFIVGIKVIRHEGLKPSNLLSLLFSILLSAYLVIWPRVANLADRTLSALLYVIISLFALYLLCLMAMYSLSAVLNLIHLRKRRRADYIIVLGCKIMGSRVTPLLAARIERGIELLRCNPRAVLILSGGQGPGEDMPESEAMAAYALEKGVDPERILTESRSVSTQENLLFSMELITKEKPRILLVTTAYHVFRALILAKQQGIRCVGYGAKTKWYFTLNAIIREFIGYLHLSWKKHFLVIGCLTAVLAVLYVITWLI